MIWDFLKQRRPPIEIRDQVDIDCRIEENNVIIYEIRPQWNDKSEIIESPIAKASFNKTKKVWNLYWQKSDLKFHTYDPNPHVKDIEEFYSIVDKDAYNCFWGWK